METAEVFRRSKGRPRWWGGKKHIVFTVVLFVVLATLDNAAIGVVPSLFPVIAEDLSVEESALGFVMALSILIAAFTSVLWGYLGDRTSRKRLLLYGTLIWGIATALTGSSQSFLGYLLFQVITALGLGSIASVGFSVLSDFVTPRRRGLIMSLWGMSQGIGMGGGLFLGGLLGAEDWRVPFFVISGAGLGFRGALPVHLRPGAWQNRARACRWRPVG